MAGKDELPTPAYTRGERPWLLPYNRKLRHLQGITIRNVALPQDTIVRRERGKTIDDDALPQSLKTPAKILAQRGKKELTHARSSSDLRSISEASVAEAGADGSAAPEAAKSSPNRPRMKPLRRRSSMAWSGASPMVRQKKLEHIAAERMLDTFFSLHVEGQQEPIYVSETAVKAVQPGFRFFDIESCGPAVTRLEDLTIQLFAKNQTMKDYHFILDAKVNLPSLHFIGRTIDGFGQLLPENAILFHMTDGIYTSLTHLPSDIASVDGHTGKPRALMNRILPTSSYDALMRLSTLDTCIQDALHTRARLATQISELLEANKAALSTTHGVSEAQDAASRVLSAAKAQRKRLEATLRRRDDLQESIQHRRQAMQKGRQAQERVAEDMRSDQVPLDKRKAECQRTLDEMVGQRRRCCEDLQSIYPIEPVPTKSLSFTIRGLSLPNSNFEDCDELSAAAALGYVAHTVHLLSFYLATPLPYPIRPQGSTSTIHDPISETPSQGGGPPTYPLFLKGAVRYRFEYAVFLLNKNIEILACHLGLKIMDIRQTLPNLKYLLYIATSGKGDLPSRKASGIRALLLRRGEGSGGTTPTTSRVGSDDGSEAGSERGRVHASTAADILRSKLPERHLGLANGKPPCGKSPANAQLSRLRDVS